RLDRDAARSHLRIRPRRRPRIARLLDAGELELLSERRLVGREADELGAARGVLEQPEEFRPLGLGQRAVAIAFIQLLEPRGAHDGTSAARRSTHSWSHLRTRESATWTAGSVRRTFWATSRSDRPESYRSWSSSRDGAASIRRQARRREWRLSTGSSDLRSAKAASISSRMRSSSKVRSRFDFSRSRRTTLRAMPRHHAWRSRPSANS